MRTIIEKTYKPTMSEHPVWVLSRKVTMLTYKFDVLNPYDGNVLAQSYLSWKMDSNDTYMEERYHGCSYMFTGYNPLPTSGWFRGIPRNQMLEWCNMNHLRLVGCVKQYITLEFVDDSYEATHPDF